MHDTLAWALANQRDAFLTSRPVYGRLELDFFNKSGVKVEYAETEAENAFDEAVVDKFEEAYENCKSRHVNVKAVFIINPHNPLGKSCQGKGKSMPLTKAQGGAIRVAP